MAEPPSPRHTRAERAESIEHAVDFLVHAARLRQRAYSWEKKRRAIDSGRQVVFFADNDVVILFTEPNRIGPAGLRPNDSGYGMIFPDDTPTEATDIAALLGEHIFHELPSPLLQFTSHAAELGTIIESIARRSNNPPDWRRPPEELQTEQIRTFLAEITSQDEPNLRAISQGFHDIVRQSDPNQREEFANKLLELLFAPQSASLALVRFLQLLSSQLLLPVEAVSVQRAEEWHQIVRQPQTIREMVYLSRATDDWFERLQNVKYGERNLLTVQRDAQALAYLSYYNSRLEDENAEVCLITGDAAIWRLAAQYPQLQEWLVDPRALVIEALDHWSRDHGNGAFKVAVQGILAPFGLDEIFQLSRGGKDTRRRLVTSFGRVNDSAAEMYRTNVEQWATVKNAFLSERLVSEGGYHDLVRDFLRSIEKRSVEDIEVGLMSLRKSIDETLAGEWEKLELDFSEIGINLLLAFRDSSTARRWRPRNPPTVIFDTYTHTDALARTLLRERQGSANLTEKLKEVGDDGTTEAEKRYLIFLVYGILAASEGRWSIANVFARRACAIAKHARAEHPSPLDGREALYVRAQAERCLATSSGQLGQARQMLADARAALERSKGTRRVIKGLRFDSEEVALDLTGFHFQTWIERTNVMPESSQEVLRSIERIAMSLAKYCREGDEKLVETLGSYSFVNAVQLVHLELRNHRSPSDELRSLCLSMWERYGKALATDANQSYHISYLMASYVTFFRVYFEGKKPDKTFHELREHMVDYCVVLYDKQRYGDLFRRIERLSKR